MVSGKPPEIGDFPGAPLRGDFGSSRQVTLLDVRTQRASMRAASLRITTSAAEHGTFGAEFSQHRHHERLQRS
jgi:hypothetical protein